MKQAHTLPGPEGQPSRSLVRAAAKCLGIIMLACSLGDTAEAVDSSDAVARILAQWNQRRQSAPTFAYEATGRAMVPRGTYNGDPDLAQSATGDIPPQDTHFEVQYKLVIDLPQHRARAEEQGKIMHLSLGRFTPLYTVHTFDGHRPKKYQPADLNKDDSYKLGKNQVELYLETTTAGGPFFAVEHFPFLLSHGILPLRDLDPAALDRIPPANRFRYHGPSSLGQVPCTVVRTGSASGMPGTFEEYWVSDKHAGEVVRWSEYMSGKVVHQIDIEYDHASVPSRPKRWISTRYGRPPLSPLQRRVEVDVTSFVANAQIMDAKFDIPLKPAMVVYDSGSQKWFRVHRDGKTLVEFDPRIEPKEESSLAQWALLTGSPAVAGVGLWFMWRTWRRRRGVIVGTGAS